ncbi:hypothetical protein V6R21_22870 [Limibacter armeniacum]|uniref:arsenate reductase family protein n=1 Tax=Limibacter armeniacum TaxID=466084 RepID=UPI002FE53325
MESLKSHKFTFIYNGSEQHDKKLLGYLNASKTKFHQLDIVKTPLTEQQLAEIATGLKVPVHQLVAKGKAKEKGVSFDDITESEVLTVLVKNPDLLQTPILGLYREYRIVKDIADVNRLDALVKQEIGSEKH